MTPENIEALKSLRTKILADLTALQERIQNITAQFALETSELESQLGAVDAAITEAEGTPV